MYYSFDTLVYYLNNITNVLGTRILLHSDKAESIIRQVVKIQGMYQTSWFVSSSSRDLSTYSFDRLAQIAREGKQLSDEYAIFLGMVGLKPEYSD
jgi:hypothetical protein